MVSCFCLDCGGGGGGHGWLLLPGLRWTPQLDNAFRATLTLSIFQVQIAFAQSLDFVVSVWEIRFGGLWIFVDVVPESTGHVLRAFASDYNPHEAPHHWK